VAAWNIRSAERRADVGFKEAMELFERKLLMFDDEGLKTKIPIVTAKKVAYEKMKRASLAKRQRKEGEAYEEVLAKKRKKLQAKITPAAAPAAAPAKLKKRAPTLPLPVAAPAAPSVPAALSAPTVDTRPQWLIDKAANAAALQEKKKKQEAEAVRDAAQLQEREDREAATAREVSNATGHLVARSYTISSASVLAKDQDGKEVRPGTKEGTRGVLKDLGEQKGKQKVKEMLSDHATDVDDDPYAPLPMEIDSSLASRQEDETEVSTIGIDAMAGLKEPPRVAVKPPASIPASEVDLDALISNYAQQTARASQGE